jgi:hypothetical protein
MSHAEVRRLRLVNELRAAGWRSAVVDNAVLVLYRGRAWEVVGGTTRAPSMKMRPELRAKSIRWSE